MITFTLGMVCGAALIMSALFMFGNETEEFRKVQAKFKKLEDENERLEDLLTIRNADIEYLTQANQTLRQNKGRIPREDEQ